MLSGSNDPLRSSLIAGYALTVQRYCNELIANQSVKKSKAETTKNTQDLPLSQKIKNEIDFLIHSVQERFTISPLEIIFYIHFDSNIYISLISLIIKNHWNDLLDEYLDMLPEDFPLLTFFHEVEAAGEYNYYAFEKIGRILKNRCIDRNLALLINAALDKTAPKEYIPQQEKIVTTLLAELAQYPMKISTLEVAPGLSYLQLLDLLAHIEDEFVLRLLDPKTTLASSAIDDTSTELEAKSTDDSSSTQVTRAIPRQFNCIETWANTINQKDKYKSQLQYTVEHVYRYVLLPTMRNITENNVTQTAAIVSCFIRMFPLPHTYLDTLLLVAIECNAAVLCPHIIELLKLKGAALSQVELDSILHRILENSHKDKNAKKIAQNLINAGAKVNNNLLKGSGFLALFERGYRDGQIDILQMVLTQQGDTFQKDQLNNALKHILSNACDAYSLKKSEKFPNKLAIKIAAFLSAGADPNIKFTLMLPKKTTTTLLAFLAEYKGPTALIELCETKMAVSHHDNEIPMADAKYFKPSSLINKTKHAAYELEEKIASLVFDSKEIPSEDSHTPLFIINIQTNLLTEMSADTLRAALNWLIRVDLSLQLTMPKANFFYTQTFLSRLREAIQDFLGLMCSPSQMPLYELLSSNAPESVVLTCAEILLESGGLSQLTYLSKLKIFFSLKFSLTQGVKKWLNDQLNDRPDDILDLANNINNLVNKELKNTARSQHFDHNKSTYFNLSHHFEFLIGLAKRDNVNPKRFAEWVDETSIDHAVEAGFFDRMQRSMQSTLFNSKEAYEKHKRCFKRHQGFIESVESELQSELKRLNIR